MERRRFVLSWGRKIFFGLAWPLLCVLSLVFLKSGVIPKDAVSLFYYTVTTIGYYGFVTSVLYFFFYVPFAVLFPTYYFVRLWSAFLVLLISAAVLLDGFVFGEYRFHINQLVLRILSSQGPAEIFNGSMSAYFVTGGVTLFLFFAFWLRGEWLWRVMQRRFSNPVKNWYLLFIVLCLGISHFVWNNQRTEFFGNEITLASVFPVNYQEIFYPKIHTSTEVSKADLHYPKKDLKCKPKSFPNIIYIVLEGVDSQTVNADITPFLVHLQEHGMNFTTHLSGGGTSEDNLFRLLYGIPASYRPEAMTPALINELKKNKYELAVFSERRIPGLPYLQNKLPEWTEARKVSETQAPLFAFFDLYMGSPSELDLRLKETFTILQEQKLLSGSVVVITGTQNSEWGNVPMTVIMPDREKGTWDHRTTHYDVAPTIMKKVMNCSTPFSAYAYGKDLTDRPSKDWEVFGNENVFRIVDFTNHNIIESDWHGKISSGDLTRSELVLKASKEISRFYR